MLNHKGHFALLAISAGLANAIPTPDSFVSMTIKRMVSIDDIKDFVQREKTRMNSFASIDSATIDSAGSASITNNVVSYIASAVVGSQTFNIIVDTGSSNTWVGATAAYKPGSSSSKTGNSVSVSYGSGSFSGTEYFDTVNLGGVIVKKQSIGAASTSTGFQGTDGILGLGPVALTRETVQNTATVPTFLDNLKSTGTISTETLGIYFAPEKGSDSNDKNGELTFGGVDTAKYTGALTYFPRSTTSPFAPYWGINVASITFGATNLGATGAIVDTGTTLIYIPTTAYKNFLSLSKGTTDSKSGLASFTTKPTANFAFKFGTTTYTLTPAQYLVPAAEYALFGLTNGQFYAWINDGGSSGVNCIIGQKFLENYYSVFDTTNSRIGFATRA